MNAEDFLGFSNIGDDALEFDIPDLDSNFLENNNLFFKSPDISCMYFTPFEEHKEVKLSVSLEGILQLRPAEKIRTTVIFPFDSEIFQEHSSSLNTLDKWDLKGIAIQCTSRDYYPTPQSPPVRNAPVLHETKIINRHGVNGFEIIFWLSEKENGLSKYENGMFCLNFRIMSYHKKEFQTADIRIKFQIYIPHTLNREESGVDPSTAMNFRKTKISDEDEEEGEDEDEEEGGGDGFNIPIFPSFRKKGKEENEVKKRSMVDEDEEEEEDDDDDEDNFNSDNNTFSTKKEMKKASSVADNLEFRDDFFHSFESSEPATKRKVQYVNKVLVSIDQEDETMTKHQYDVSWKGEYRKIPFNSNYLSTFSSRATSSSEIEKSKVMNDEDENVVQPQDHNNNNNNNNNEKEDLKEDQVSNSYHKVFQGLLDLVENPNELEEELERKEKSLEDEDDDSNNSNPFEAGGLKYFYEDYSVTEYSLQVVPFPFHINKSQGVLYMSSKTTNFIRVRMVFSAEIAKRLQTVIIGPLFRENQNINKSKEEEEEDLMRDDDEDKMLMREQSIVRMRVEKVQLNDSSPNFWKMVDPESSPEENIMRIQDPRIDADQGILFFSVQLNNSYEKFEKSKFCRICFMVGIAMIQCEVNIIFEFEKKNKKNDEENKDELEEEEESEDILGQVKQMRFRVNSKYEIDCDALSVNGDTCSISNQILLPLISRCENKHFLM